MSSLFSSFSSSNSKLDNRLKKLVSTIAFQFSKLGLSWNEISIFLRELNGTHENKLEDDKINSIAKDIIEEKIPNDHKAFKSFVDLINEQFDLNIDTSIFDSRIRKIWKLIKAFLISLLFIFVFWFVIGGIIEGHSVLMKDSHPLLGLLILFILLFLLAVVEGLHVTVTKLSLKDLYLIKDKYPRLYKLHKKFRSQQGTNKFLAGRQLIVIIIIFFLAQLTSFSKMNTIPFINCPLPSWFQRIFLELGILGSLFVLWFGQLIPQFYANKNPHGFMEFFPVNLIFKFTYLLESIELTRPAHYIARKISKNVSRAEDIPISPAEKYRLEVDYILGFGILGIKKIWEINKDESVLYYQSSTIFKKQLEDTFLEQSLYVKSVANANFNFKLISSNSNGAPDSDSVTFFGPINSQKESIGQDDWKRVIQSVRPKFGAFKPNDILIGTTTVKIQGTGGIDMIGINLPTKYILFTIKFLNEPNMIFSPKIEVYRRSSLTGNLEKIKDISLDLIRVRDDKNNINMIAQFIKLYPTVNDFYRITWNVEY